VWCALCLSSSAGCGSIVVYRPYEVASEVLYYAGMESQMCYCSFAVLFVVHLQPAGTTVVCCCISVDLLERARLRLC
jgi:hypothetical protein